MWVCGAYPSGKKSSDRVGLYGNIWREYNNQDRLFYKCKWNPYYVDFTTQDAIPVCNKPDCRHLSKAEDADTECDAAIDGARVFPYKGKLLGISEDSKGNEEIYSSDIDGSNRKVKKKLESSNMFINEGVIAKDSFFLCSNNA